MAITNTWIIEQMDCVPNYEQYQDVVITAHWRVNATDGTYNSTVYGTQSFTFNGSTPFTPYADLTQAQVIGWVQDAMGPEQVAQIELSLATSIENQINPPVITPPLPWNSGN